MPLPEINYCIVCEGVRSEERHKAIIFGFFNVLPWVVIKVSELEGSGIQIMFLLGTSGGTGNANFQLSVFDPDGTELMKTPELLVAFVKGLNNTNVGMGVTGLRFKHTGKHAVKVSVSGQLKYESTFDVELDPSLKPPANP